MKHHYESGESFFQWDDDMLGFWRRGRAVIGRWASAHPWLGLIVTSFIALTIHKAIGIVFDESFPVLSEILDNIVEQSLPIVFYISGFFLLFVLALLIVSRLFGSAYVASASQGTHLSGRQFSMTIAVIVVCVGIAFLDAYLAGGAKHFMGGIDR